MIRLSSAFLFLLVLASCAGNEQQERELRRQARIDSLFRADSAYKAGAQHKEYKKAVQDSLMQVQSFKDQIIKDSLEKAEEMQKYKWKRRDPPKPAPKKMKKAAKTS